MASLAVGLSLYGVGLAPAQQRAPVPAVNTASRAQVLALYRHYYLAPAPAPGWTGNAAAHSPGAVSDDFLCATLRRINYYRAMSGLRGDMAFDPALNAACQQAALMMALERHVSHHPPVFWKGYTPTAALAADNSDLCMNWSADLGPGAVDRYIAEDEANNAYVGHRRWLLYPAAGMMGAGIVPTEGREHPGANAVWVRPTPAAFTAVANNSATAPGAPRATAWPPAGYVPAPLVYARWSLSCANADFRAAVVRVTKNGASLAVVPERLEYQTNSEGSGTGVGLNTLVWTLPGNTVRANADETYWVQVANVRVNGARRDLTYPVVSIDPAVSSPQDTLLVRNDLAPGSDPAVVSTVANAGNLKPLTILAR